MADLTDLVEPSVDDRLPRLLMEMGLDRSISWQKAVSILDSYELPSYPPYKRSQQHLQSPTATERDLAFAIHLKQHVTGRHDPAEWLRFWAGANPEEAFLLDLRIVGNPGDHSGLHTRSPEHLLQDLVILRLLPPTRWRHERIAATRLERKRRAGE